MPKAIREGGIVGGLSKKKNVKFGTSGLRVGTRTGAGVTATLG